MYLKIRKEMSFYFGLDVFCQFEARVPEFEAVFRARLIEFLVKAEKSFKRSECTAGLIVATIVLC
jgi:hypothetical protein